MALDEPPTAILATNEIVAAGAMASAHALGLRMPQDLSLASLSDGMVAELLTPSLTAARFPLDRLGYQATSMLVDIVEGRPLAQPGDMKKTAAFAAVPAQGRRRRLSPPARQSGAPRRPISRPRRPRSRPSPWEW
ncbi:substrate-binding domain-containing protein [Bordetella trematum]|uniref:substrate-binding domain-containing protein n=1 Tax=Bordetella trematum TaxID=123899 RepID=UPI003989388E